MLDGIGSAGGTSSLKSGLDTVAIIGMGNRQQLGGAQMLGGDPMDGQLAWAEEPSVMHQIPFGTA